MQTVFLSMHLTQHKRIRKLARSPSRISTTPSRSPRIEKSVPRIWAILSSFRYWRIAQAMRYQGRLASSWVLQEREKHPFLMCLLTESRSRMEQDWLERLCWMIGTDWMPSCLQSIQLMWCKMMLYSLTSRSEKLYILLPSWNLTFLKKNRQSVSIDWLMTWDWMIVLKHKPGLNWKRRYLAVSAKEQL